MEYGSKDRHIRKPLLVLSLVLLCGALALCYIAAGRHERTASPVQPGRRLEAADVDRLFPQLAVTAADRSTEAGEAAVIDLSAKDETVLITEGGEYRLTGKMKGQVRIAAEEQTVHLVLDNCSVTSREGPAL